MLGAINKVKKNKKTVSPHGHVRRYRHRLLLKTGHQMEGFLRFLKKKRRDYVRRHFIIYSQGLVATYPVVAKKRRYKIYL